MQPVPLLAPAALLALAVGLVLGMLGGGGAILTLPMLVYVLGVAPKTAVAMSLVVVGSTSLFGTIVHARAGNVDWKTGGVFGLAAMAGAFAGARLARLVPATALLVLFGVVMVVTATVLLARTTVTERGAASRRLGAALGLGGAVGLLSGLVGAGGGFLIVPALVLFGGLAMRRAIGTSLFVITLQAFAGFAGHVGHVQIDWALALTVTSASVVGGVTGAQFAARVSPAVLRRGFAWLVIAMAMLVFAKELPAAVAIAASAIALLAALLAARRSVPERSPRAAGPAEPPALAAPRS